MSEQSREQFEAWFEAHTKDWPFPSEAIKCVARDYDWLVWQASRQAIEVELPDLVGLTNAEEIDGSAIAPREDRAYDQAIDECREAIESCGLRVKP